MDTLNFCTELNSSRNGVHSSKQPMNGGNVYSLLVRITFFEYNYMKVVNIP